MTAKRRNLEAKFANEESRQRLHLVCKAILLCFNDPKVYDLSIPDAHNIKALVKIACRLMTGEKIRKTMVNCVTSSDTYSPLTVDHLDIMAKRYGQKDAEDIFMAVMSPRDIESVLEMELSDRGTYRHEWFCGNGDWYEFRTYKREEADLEVIHGLKQSTITHILDMGNLFAPFIGITNSPAKCSG